MSDMSVKEIIDRCEEIFEDLNFTYAREWKVAEDGRKVVGYMPVYVPNEIIHAAGMLPIGILGGGDAMEVIHGDAYYQSYICRIPRSTVELGIMKNLDFVDGMLFPSICDVIRNLSGVWKLLFPEVYARYFDTPQNFRSDIGGEFYKNDLQELREGLEKLGGREITDDDLRNSIQVYNENRDWVRKVYQFRSDQPWKVPASEVYLLMRAGEILTPEDHTQMMKDYLAAVENEERRMKDNCRVVLNGSFCEQPPLGLVKSIELAGCYVVDDDYMMINRMITEDIPTDGDPLLNLSEAFLKHSLDLASKFEPSEEKKGKFIVELVRERGAEGVIFSAPSFCDPALLDQPMLAHVLDDANIPYISFQYAENSGQMQPIREQAGTFADSIKLWSAA
ncbi:MAG TPA: benzoyl-CoA reductase subunit C [Rhodospirillales bacterium]|jgi:benzoyl-CoA reductase subunit C|nr:benzoyl-CoA reductase subunit C [Rhodospirillales bacterium]MDP7424718.1 benzoyl-CoA reductase subunit C [Rhodospirillales bacterium]HJO86784.1 benzoyl-CoA reductase subunit C [Rhodospirillales bacterium]